MRISPYSVLTSALCLTATAFTASACSDSGKGGPIVGPGGMAGAGAPAAGAGGMNGGGGGMAPGGGGQGPGGMAPGGMGPGGMGGSAGSGGSAGAAGSGGGGGEVPTYPGFTLTINEEFTTPIDFDDPNSIWTWSDGALDEGQVRFAREGISFTDGKMIITASSDPLVGGFSHAEEKMVSDKALRSGELRTKYNNYRYGRYEVRLKAPTIDGNTANNGNYIATLFIFRTPKFQSWNEIDIEVTGGGPDELTTNLVHGENRPTWEETFQNVSESLVPFNARDDFHTYAFEWTSESIIWYADNMEIRRLEATNLLGIPALSAKIMMSMWIFAGGPNSFGGDPSTNVYPFSVEYDWFRFYKWNEETTYPLPIAELPAVDMDGSKNNAEDGVPDIDPSCDPGTCIGADDP